MSAVLRVPPPIPADARIALVAPGSALPAARIAAAVRVLRSWGYRPVVGPHASARRGDLAGDDAGRAADLAWALGDPAIDAVWALRGGWGTPRLLPLVDWDALAARPRWVLGFSDITALHAQLLARGVPALHAPLASELDRPVRYVARDLRRTLEDPLHERSFRLAARAALVPGRAAGPLAGGCLTLLATLAGTPWQPRLAGTLLFLEEVAETPYRIDRMLWQLRLSGMLDGIAGLVLGQFVNCRPPRERPSRSLAAVLREHAAALGVPAVTGLPVGHGLRTRVLPLGVPAELDTGAGQLRVPAVAR